MSTGGNVYTLEPDGQVVFHRYATGETAREVPMPEVGGATVTSSSRSLLGGFVAAGLSDGRVSLAQVRAVPVYDGEALKDLSIDVRRRAVVALDPEGRRIQQVSYIEMDGRKYLAGLATEHDILAWWTDDADSEHRATLSVGPTLALVAPRHISPTFCQSASVGCPEPTPGIFKIVARRSSCAKARDIVPSRPLDPAAASAPALAAPFRTLRRLACNCISRSYIWIFTACPSL